MGTPFISHLEPTLALSHQWDRSLPSTAQPHAASLPRTFLDAMSVREAVYVQEQGVPQEVEFDDDDARSCHWVIYASVHRVVEPEQRDPSTGEVTRSRRSETKTLPIGTIRLVPFPHPLHPQPGGNYVDGRCITTTTTTTAPQNNLPPLSQQQQQQQSHSSPTSPSSSSSSSSSSGHHHHPHNPTTTGDRGRGMDRSTSTRSSNDEEGEEFERRVSYSAIDRQTDFHDGEESYVKLGRLAVVKEFRGHGLAGQLVRTALDWMRHHPGYFNPSPAQLGFETLGMDVGGELPKWRGLVCCHAQEGVVDVWAKCGFQEDKAMGRWTEEGIPHLGMFLRLDFEPEPPKI
ncbi:hypothetical protein QBC46DRAFT_388307 [Diplogelasinospora grovesii]|uniref:N-acetyltransferase domain-containing protein n=1 Tax=Diplogelasinospora grovesii TaxID=303347 RepID=A0AAN6S438_9PEZI|nr:hypothetical protein QBC46DRAFT_388307 [Diplogelasinospora grovesii]